MSPVRIRLPPPILKRKVSRIGHSDAVFVFFATCIFCVSVPKVLQLRAGKIGVREICPEKPERRFLWRVETYILNMKKSVLSLVVLVSAVALAQKIIPPPRPMPQPLVHVADLRAD